jgi:hypothetical protein
VTFSNLKSTKDVRVAAKNESAIVCMCWAKEYGENEKSMLSEFAKMVNQMFWFVREMGVAKFFKKKWRMNAGLMRCEFGVGFLSGNQNVFLGEILGSLKSKWCK